MAFGMLRHQEVLGPSNPAQNWIWGEVILDVTQLFLALLEDQRNHVYFYVLA